MGIISTGSFAKDLWPGVNALSNQGHYAERHIANPFNCGDTLRGNPQRSRGNPERSTTIAKASTVKRPETGGTLRGGDIV